MTRKDCFWWAAALAILATACWVSMVLNAMPAQAQCPSGQCQAGPQFRGATVQRPRSWSYVHPDAHRAAVVRVIAYMPDGSQQMGSGVVVQWSAGVPVIVTAAHVVRGAVKVVIRVVRFALRLSVVVSGVDARYDVACLALASGENFPQEVALAAVQIDQGEAAIPRIGEELESVGFGSDEKLAANVGTVLGLVAPFSGGAADSVEIAGWTRQGDSGGPIFNARGRLAGIVCSRDMVGPSGPSVGRLNGLQAGRIATFLQGIYGPAIVKQPQQCGPGGRQNSGRSRIFGGSSDPGVPVPSPAPPLTRPLVPVTPPAIEMESAPSGGCLPGLFGRRETAPSGPQVIVQSDPAIRVGLDGIGRRLDVIVGQLDKSKEPPPEPAKSGPPAWLVILVVVGGVIAGAMLYFATQSHTPVD